MNFLTITYGCQMNDLDSETINGLLAAKGWTKVGREEDADVILINTCCVRYSAEKRALGRLTQLAPLKKQKHSLVIGICGCIAQKDGADLLTRYPFLDLVVGTRDFFRIPELLDVVTDTRSRLCAVESIEQPVQEKGTPLRQSSLKARVNIIYGCDNFCSYCIVPHVRGREQSRPPDDIVDEIRTLADNGCKEVLLLGQNVNSYSYDGTNFPDLLERVNEVSGIERIRYITSHPKDASDKLIECVASLGKVCENFHLPIQSGNNRILELMNRKYTRENYFALVDKIRARIPGAVITTDIMAGFPGETEEEFGDSLDAMRRVRWDSAFMFMYTPRPGTVAAEMKDRLTREEKVVRLEKMIEIQERISGEKNKDHVGSREEVLVEGVSRRSKDQLMGRIRGDKVVIFDAPPSLIGRIVKITITASAPHTLFGSIVPDFV